MVDLPRDPWTIVEWVWDKERCPSDCRYLHRWTEPHGEHLCNCHLLEGEVEGGAPEDCPEFEIALEALSEESQNGSC